MPPNNNNIQQYIDNYYFFNQVIMTDCLASSSSSVDPPLPLGGFHSSSLMKRSPALMGVSELLLKSDQELARIMTQAVHKEEPEEEEEVEEEMDSNESTYSVNSESSFWPEKFNYDHHRVEDFIFPDDSPTPSLHSSEPMDTTTATDPYDDIPFMDDTEEEVSWPLNIIVPLKADIDECTLASNSRDESMSSSPLKIAPSGIIDTNVKQPTIIINPPTTTSINNNNNTTTTSTTRWSWLRLCSCVSQRSA